MRILAFAFLLVMVLASGCQNLNPPSGKDLSERYCGGCHLVPEPSLLSKKSWQNGVLPEMAYHLGMRPLTDKLNTLSIEEFTDIVRAGIYPAGPMLSERDWKTLQEYYIANAPEKPLSQAEKMPVAVRNDQFRVIQQKSERTEPMVSMVKINPETHQLAVCYRENNLLLLLNSNLETIQEFPVGSPVSDLYFEKNGGILALEMGKMDPNDLPAGRLVRLRPQQPAETLIDSLRRPVNLLVDDFNNDGVNDYLICAYGNEIGNLSWYDGTNLQAHVLTNIPGARKVYYQDMNHDGKKDIVALFCQAREHIAIWFQENDGTYTSETVLQFPPVYGSGDFLLTDLNGDGWPDIAYVNGDNADYSAELKGYHGLHLFLSSDSGKTFKEEFFYPIHGAGMISARDFDQDAKEDICVAAFFTSRGQIPNEGFLYFRKEAHLKYQVSTIAEASLGHWLVMDSGDLDGDGKPDIVLGNFVKGGLSQGSRKQSATALLLLR